MNFYYFRLRNFVKTKTLRPRKSEIPAQTFQWDAVERRKAPRYHAKRKYKQYDLTDAQRLLFQGWDALDNCRD